MKDINDILPKIPNMQWGAVTNLSPTNANLKYLNKMLPHDKKWHTILDSKDFVDVDGITIPRKTAHSMS